MTSQTRRTGVLLKPGGAGRCLHLFTRYMRANSFERNCWTHFEESDDCPDMVGYAERERGGIYILSS